MEETIIEKIEREEVERNKGVKFTKTGKQSLKILAAQFDCTMSEAVGIARMILDGTSQVQGVCLVDKEDREDEKEMIADWIMQQIDEYDVEKRVTAKLFEED